MKPELANGSRDGETGRRGDGEICLYLEYLDADGLLVAQTRITRDWRIYHSGALRVIPKPLISAAIANKSGATAPATGSRVVSKLGAIESEPLAAGSQVVVSLACLPHGFCAVLPESGHSETNLDYIITKLEEAQAALDERPADVIAAGVYGE